MEDEVGRHPSGRATHEQNPQAVSAVPVGIPDAVARAARAIAANKRGLPIGSPEVDRVWFSYCGQARAALAAGWATAPASGVELAIEAFKQELPGWWFTVGECSVSADASCGPDRTGPDAALLANRLFDDGFHADLPQPASMAEALANVTAQAIEARRAETGTGSVHESAVRKDGP